VFTTPTSGFDHQFAIMLQPYATGNKNLVMTVTDQRSDYFDFSTVEFDGTDWSIPASQAGFGLVIFDMVETNDGL
jgi:anti-sigma regulatory factor (Ser/Thr protein kinase)